MSRAPDAAVGPAPTTVTTSPQPALRLDDVSVTIAGREVLHHISWQVAPGERWVVLGRNGCGKTTLLRVASLTLHPSSGELAVLGEVLGRTDVRALRPRIGLASAAMADRLRPGLPAVDAVMTAKHGALEPWWDTYTDEDRRRATSLLARLQVGHVADQPFGTLSSGERQRVLLARTLMNDPGLLLLDEPTAGLDLGGREDLVRALDDLAATLGSPPMVLVTHHVEEIPSRFTHVLLLRAGSILAAGPIDDTLDDERLSACFDLELTVSRAGGRWTAQASPGTGARP